MHTLTVEQPIAIEEQIIQMRKYITFRNTKKMKQFLKYVGYFRASRYGKYLLSNTLAIQSKPTQEMLFSVYYFDVELRKIFFKYCKIAEIQFKSYLSNSVSLKTKSSIFYLEDEMYTSSKGEKDKSKKKYNQSKFEKFLKLIKEQEKELRKYKDKYPELKEYRSNGIRKTQKIPCWAAFSYFDFGTITTMYSYLKGDLKKAVLVYGYSQCRYSKADVKNVDTWLSAIRNLRNVCSHHNRLVGKTSSVVLFSNDDTAFKQCAKTQLLSRMYALKKIIPQQDSNDMQRDINKLIKKAKFDVYAFGILPDNWEFMYSSIKPL